MRQWNTKVTESAKRDLNDLDSSVKKGVLDKLAWFVENFEQAHVLSLHGTWKEFFKLRVKDWREKLIVVHNIKHRGKTYRQRALRVSLHHPVSF